MPKNPILNTILLCYIKKGSDGILHGIVGLWTCVLVFYECQTVLVSVGFLQRGLFRNGNLGLLTRVTIQAFGIQVLSPAGEMHMIPYLENGTKVLGNLGWWARQIKI